MTFATGSRTFLFVVFLLSAALNAMASFNADREIESFTWNNSQKAIAIVDRAHKIHGHLDPENQQRIVALLRASAEAAGAGLIMVTHEHELLEHFDRVIDLPTLMATPT